MLKTASTARRGCGCRAVNLTQKLDGRELRSLVPAYKNRPDHRHGAWISDLGQLLLGRGPSRHPCSPSHRATSPTPASIACPPASASAPPSPPPPLGLDPTAPLLPVTQMSPGAFFRGIEPDHLVVMSQGLRLQPVLVGPSRELHLGIRLRERCGNGASTPRSGPVGPDPFESSDRPLRGVPICLRGDQAEQPARHRVRGVVEDCEPQGLSRSAVIPWASHQRASRTWASPLLPALLLAAS